ncbi:enoyl-CoA hydratase/isomerase family protein [Mycobacterium sp. CVI_P3]|uniref:Enoyl-CoA hydratase/isomerase family protein n=1 Tax=Mycobacterium pinniadriaticum TaxID=2994102 RepID=A0ABT3SEL7_9MYCO|nr:enoyl-CoA hydratase/isomerase family protein [Mycobacterium pinniadriaticum]MCX2931665.1 enoyl-CoA hydratase/isomerase family protein [Mycobacterium pinniadriaticum]MCX2937943.1 enoyl-CoA hydratase/isomerase family protein [Mycobacterium pinniadriaticum]
MTSTETRGHAVPSDPVLLEIRDDGVAVISLNRPDAANAMDLSLLTALHRALLDCHRSAEARVVVLRGEGRNFCAGGDVHDFLANVDRLPEHVKEVSSWLQTVTSAIIALEVPVIAAVHGYATGGGGLGLVGSCDFVIASQTARFRSGAIGVGMAPDGGLTVTLTQLVGFRKAVEIVLSNATVDAEEALRIGLISRVVPDDMLMTEAYALAQSLAGCSPQALAECKRLLWDGIGSRVVEGLADEARAEVRLAGTAECHARLASVASRRRPPAGTA